MENKLDKLFRDQLENHSVKPSANAWERVKIGTPKKNNNLVWASRIAAALLLMGVTGWFAYTQFADQENLQVVQKAEPKDEVKPLDIPKKEVQSEKKVTPANKQQIESPSINQSRLKPQPVVQQPVAKVGSEIVQQEEMKVSEAIAVVETASTPTILTLPVVEQKKVKPMVIVYTLAAVETKQSVEPAKVKPFRKMIEFAQDVKGGEVTLASVRNWKDNIFGVEEQAVVEKQNN